MTGSPNDEGIIISAGSHLFPFEFTLPRDLPASYDGVYGQVKYGVRAMLVRPWKFDIEREKDFEVTGYMDMNEEPDLAVSTAAIRGVCSFQRFIRGRSGVWRSLGWASCALKLGG
jgi:hypothetical protein